MATNYDINIRAKDQTGGTFNSIERKMRGIESSSSRISKSGAGFAGLTRFINPATVAITGLGVAFTKTASFALESARAYENTVNQLRLVTKGTEDFVNQQARLRTLAQQNRTSFDATVELYTKLTVATEELGYSSQTVEDLTTKLSQALAVAGADAGTAAGVIKQFGQAMASGVVRGDEFNSIVEGLGPALAIMARESGIGVGQLRELAHGGELTAEKFAELLLNSNALSESFNKLEPTMDQVDELLGNSLTNLGAAIDRYFGLSEAVKAVKTQAAGLADDLAEALAPKTELEKLTEQLQNINSEIDIMKRNAISGGRNIVPTIPGIGLGDQGGFGPGLIVEQGAMPGLEAQQAALAALEQQRKRLIDQIAVENNMRRVQFQQLVAEAEATHALNLAKEAEAARIKMMEEAYKSMGNTRTIAGQKALEMLKLEEERQAKIKQILAEQIPFIEQYRAKHKEAMDSIKLLNDELANNSELTMGQRRAIRAAIEDLTEQKNLYHDMAKAGEVYSEHVFQIEQALKANNEERLELLEIQKLLIAKSEQEGEASEVLKAQLNSLTAALEANADARREITRIPLTLDEEIQKMRDRVEVMKSEKALNADILKALQAEGVEREYLENLGLIARERGGRRTKEQLSESEQIVKALGEEKKKYEELTATIANDAAIQALSKKYGVAGDEIKKALEKARDAIKKTNSDVVTLADIMKDKFKTLSEGLASSLTDALLNGKEGFENFKDYLRNWAKSIMSTIIEKLLIQPMIDQMTNWMGFTNKNVGGILGGIVSGPGAGAAPAAGGGLLNGLLGMFQGGGFFSNIWSAISGFGSSLWSGISNFFGNIPFLANGGYLPAGKIGVAGEAGPELITGPARVYSNEDSFGGGEPVVVNFNINAIDTQTGTEFILKNKKQITGVIQDAYNRRGKQGVY